MILTSKFKKLFLIFIIFLLVSLRGWAQQDSLSAPQTSSRFTLAQPQTPSSDNSMAESEPADVVEQNRAITPSSAPLTALTSSPIPVKHPTDAPTPRRTLTSTIHQAKITTIPNPAYGDKVIFRVMTQGPATAQIIVYDRFFNKVAGLSGQGDRLFDIIWSLKQAPEGIYYYQAKVMDNGTGESQMIHMQSFAVMKDDE
jgi:hypothetical protein